MITTSEIAPSPVLSPFVRCYAHREIDTNGLDLIRPWHASHEISLTFHFDSVPKLLSNPNTGQISRTGSFGDVPGIGTQYNGEICFNGCLSIFEIIFKPNGFHKIFSFPSGEINNYIMYADDIFDSKVKIFFEQLCVANCLTEMSALADAFLLYYLNKQKSVDDKDAITAISNLILKTSGIVNVDRLAYDANMSIRTFERRFINQVGVSPKLFCCITRFNHALTLKQKNPNRDGDLLDSNPAILIICTL